MPTGDALVRFLGVQKTYDGETLVVKDLNLEIYRGEFLTLLGPSGSGKTTTLMMPARSTTSRRRSGTSAWCSRTTLCSRT
jgi:ABC-type Fe3+/spermidine/putrescine transport system ATPase subunit